MPSIENEDLICSVELQYHKERNERIYFNIIIQICNEQKRF